MIEGLWRDVITDNVLETCNEFYSSILKINVKDIGHKFDTLVDKIIALIKSIRQKSRIEMSITNESYMSAEFAFSVAFRRFKYFTYDYHFPIIQIDYRRKYRSK